MQTTIGNAVEKTLLERCRTQAECNMDNIRNISARVMTLIERLGGPLPCDEGKPMAAASGGMLHDHLTDLEIESQRLGALQADIAMLERML